jgi:hypothetical protein
MTEPLDRCEGWDDVEALVRAAGNYVRPSDDLRPRVLETARAECHERWAQQRIWQVALVVALLGVCSTSVRSRMEVAASPSGNALAAGAMVRHAEAGNDGWNNDAWNTVESFTDLRRRHAALLRLTP